MILTELCTRPLNFVLWSCRRGIEAACGKRASQTAESHLDYLCFTRNPLLAGIYVIMVAAIYYLYNVRVFNILPTTVTPLWHMCAAL